MINIKPPTHRIDGAAVFISRDDPAWDLERIVAEREAWTARALQEKRDAAPYPADPEQAAAIRETIKLTAAEEMAAIARAPVERYFAGKTRYQPGAEEWGADGKPTTVREFLQDKPAEFGLRRLGFRAYQEVLEIEATRARLIEAARRGLRSVTSEGYRWAPASMSPLEMAADEVLEALHEANPSLLPEIGAAVLNLCRPLDPEVEVPR